MRPPLALLTLCALLALAACGGSPSLPSSTATTGGASGCTVACVFLRTAGGPGLADVTICLARRSGGGTSVAMTDATGRYVAQAPGHQETIIYWPAKAGYAFTPQYGAIPPFDTQQPLTQNFVAMPASSAPSECSLTPWDA